VQRQALGFLFLFFAACFLGIAVAAAGAGGRAWVVALPACVLGLWMGSMALRALRRS
jgi:hypothetical protein